MASWLVARWFLGGELVGCVIRELFVFGRENFVSLRFLRQ